MGEFKGEDGEDIEQWCMQVARVMESFTWSQEATSRMVQTQLKDAAGRWLRGLIKSKGTIPARLDVWEVEVNNVVTPGIGLKHELLIRFRDGINERGAVEAVVDLRHRTGESVDCFYDRVVLAMDRKNYRETTAVKDTADYRTRLLSDVLIFFSAGLAEDIRATILGSPNPPTTVEGTLAAARNCELEKKRNKKPKWLAPLEGTGGESGPEEKVSEVSALTSALAEIRADLAEIKTRSAGGCWTCGATTHFQVDCPKNKLRGRGRGGTSFRGRARGQRWFRVVNRSSAARGRPAPPSRGGSGGTGGRRRLYLVEDDGAEGAVGGDGDEFETFELSEEPQDEETFQIADESWENYE